MNKQQNFMDSDKKKTIENIIDKKAAIGDTHKHNLGFETPENYFKSSRNEILNAVNLNSTNANRIIRLKKMIAYPIAASILIVIGVLFWLNTNSTNSNS